MISQHTFNAMKPHSQSDKDTVLIHCYFCMSYQCELFYSYTYNSIILVVNELKLEVKRFIGSYLSLFLFLNIKMTF